MVLNFAINFSDKFHYNFLEHIKTRNSKISLYILSEKSIRDLYPKVLICICVPNAYIFKKLALRSQQTLLSKNNLWNSSVMLAWKDLFQ